LLTDWMMPEMDGGQLIDALRANPLFEDLSIVVLSSAGSGTSGDLNGKAVYLIKPVRQSELHNIVVNVLSGEKVKPRRAQFSDGNGEVWLPKLRGRVLLAEDNLINQEVAMAMLQKIGVSARVAANGEDALNQLQENSYDLVLMDCQMPVMDGFEATQGIRQREAELGHGHIPIVALTANAIMGDREVCLAKGMDDYLSKPFTAEQLHKVLAQWLPRRDQQEQEPVEPTAPGISFDQKILAQLRNLKRGLLARVIELYMQTSPGFIHNLEQAQLADNALGRAGTTQGAAALIGDVKTLYEAALVALKDIQLEDSEA
jgi:CheY-like chemotaxis protein